MPSAPKTVAKTIQETLVAILTDAVDDLAVDETRTTTIISHIPDESFSQTGLPLVVVERPERASATPVDMHRDHETYAVPVILVDSVGVAPGSLAVSQERLGVLLAKVKLALKAEQFLRMAWLHCYESMTEWSEPSEDQGGNNLVFHELTLTVPVTVERGRTYS